MILLRFFVTFAPRLREFLGTEQHHVLHGRRVGTTPRLCHKIKIITTEKYMYFTGITIAVLTFLTIGIWHPIVIKTEYYWGTSVGLPGCVWCLGTLGHRRALRTETTRRERLVSQEPQKEEVRGKEKAPKVIDFQGFLVVDRGIEPLCQD